MCVSHYTNQRLLHTNFMQFIIYVSINNLETKTFENPTFHHNSQWFSLWIKCVMFVKNKIQIRVKSMLTSMYSIHSWMHHCSTIVASSLHKNTNCFYHSYPWHYLWQQLKKNIRFKLGVAPHFHPLQKHVKKKAYY